MAKPNELRPVGRINFVLRALLVTGTAFALEFLGDELLHLTLLPRYSYALQRVIVFCLIGLFLLAVIDGRLLDAGLPCWYRYPVFAVWLLSISLPVIWPPEWPIGLALFALLLIVGCSIPGKLVPVKCNWMGGIAEPEEKASAPIKKYRAQWLVSPVGYLRSLLTFACIWLPLIYLEDASGQGFGVWIARLGYSILSIVWFFKVLGRLDDAGRLPRARYGFLITCLVCLTGILRSLEHAGRSPQWYGFPFSSAASIVSMLTAWLRHINGYEQLALFLLIQMPLALLTSKPKSPKLLAEINRQKESRNKSMPVVKTNELALSGPFEYLRILLVIACLWIPLIYMDNAFGGSVGSWIARLGYLILGFFWLAFANGRLEDAGWAHSWYPSQYGLVVSVASLMPLAVHWVNGYGALAIFVLIQIPTVFLRSKPRPEEPSPETEEDDACLRDPLEGILVRRTDEVGEENPARRPGVLTGGNFGRAKRVPRWRRP